MGEDRLITSLTNDTVKAVRALHMRKQRDATGTFLAEGLKFIGEALDQGHAPRLLLVGQDARPHPLLDRARAETAKAGGEVVLRVEAQGLPAGWHGLHFHAKGDCSDPKFEKAGGHTHGGEKSVHGLLNASATDTGDLPNLYVGEDGTGMAEVYSGLVRLSGGTPAQNLLDADGSAVLIHANPDDHMSQPIGGAGPRIACGVIKPAR